MKNDNVKFPVLIFEKNDKKMYGYNHKNLFGDVRFFDKNEKYSGFKNIEMIDSNGSVHFVSHVIKCSSINILKSIKYVGLMVNLEPKFLKNKSHISIQDLKIRIMNHVKSNSKTWLPLDSIDGIQEMVNDAKTYKELIMIFR